MSVRDTLVLSYGWRMAGTPDPDGVVLREVMRYLLSLPRANLEGMGLFWEYAPPALAHAPSIRTHYWTP